MIVFLLRWQTFGLSHSETRLVFSLDGVREEHQRVRLSLNRFDGATRLLLLPLEHVFVARDVRRFIRRRLLRHAGFYNCIPLFDKMIFLDAELVVV